MPEDQNIEYKESWNDDYLKWIAGFANAAGGKMYIGINDDGVAVGVADSHNLMEQIPQKIRSHLGIMADVNLIDRGGHDVIEIVTQPYEVPISLRGRYYLRSGATNLELTGNNLTEFLLKKTGKSWDSVVEPNATLGDIDRESVSAYARDVAQSGRLPADELRHDTDEDLTMLLDKLNLLEGGQIRRAAVLVFGREPGRFFANPEVRIGRFGASDDDLKSQEIERGNILQLLRAVPEQLNNKFLTKASISRGFIE